MNCFPRAAEIALALDGRRTGRQWMAKCPAHSERTPSLAIREGQAGPLVHCHAGCSQADVLDALRDRGLWPDKPDRDEVDEEACRARQERARKAAADRLDDEARMHAKASSDLLRAKQILCESMAPTPESAVGLYLIGREILPPWPACIRESPKLFHKPSNSYRPAMVCPIRDLDSNEVCGVQRTYLALDGSGKAPVEPARMMLGRARHAAVKLTPDDEVTFGLGVCEGIETGLAVLSTGWAPVWALLSAGNLARLPVLADIRALTVFGDNDDDTTGAGEIAANECAGRWRAAGREVTIYIPKAAGCDWADELGTR